MNIKDTQARINLLQKYVEKIQNPALKKTCDWMVRQTPFLIGTAACKKHQAYTGGLPDHTLEVVEIALATAQSDFLKERLNLDVIIAGALWHDYGKIWDYQLNHEITATLTESYPQYVYARHRWTIGHLSRSYMEFSIKAREFWVVEDLAEAVSHAILSHHGRRDWGSPVEPLTPEALIVHQADCISDRFTEERKIHLFKRPKDGNWKEG